MTLDRPRAEDPYAKLLALPALTLSSPHVSDGSSLPDTAVGDGASPAAASLQLAFKALGRAVLSGTHRA